MDQKNNQWISPNLNCKNLERLSIYLLKRFGVKKTQKLPVMKLLEEELSKLDSQFFFEIIAVDDWMYDMNIHAICDIYRHSIQIREDVYTGAANGYGRDRFTITHEIAHYCLFVLFGCPVYKDYSTKTKSYKKQDDPEWQADTLAGYLLCTREILDKSKTENELMKNAGIGLKSAEYSFKIKKNSNNFNNKKEVKNEKRNMKQKRLKKSLA